MADRAQHLVSDAALLGRLVEDVASSSQVGLDTESNGFHAYFERVCLVQIATAGADWALDTLALDLAPLVPLLADPAREVVLHAAEYDVTCLKRDYGLSFGRIFDTHAAAKVLGLKRVGLGNLLEDQLGIKLTVDEQRSDWGRRPLSPKQLEYAFLDVQHLVPLRVKLGAQLAAAGHEAEAQAEFSRLVGKEARPREFDPEGWQRMKAARTLDGKGRGVLRELYLMRDRRAREANRPPFKVLSDLFLAEAARRGPRTEDEVMRIPGASAVALKKVAPQVLEAVAAGLAAQPLPKPQHGAQQQRWRKGGPGAPPPEVEERYERLRVWRKVEVQVIAPNAVLMAIARSAPRDLPALGKVEGMDPFRLEQYGAEILDTLGRAVPAEAVPPAQGKLF